MKLLYDKNDLPDAKKLRDDRFKWLTELGAAELSETSPADEGFLFAYQHGDEHYRNLVCNRPKVFDRPEQRKELIRLDEILHRLEERGIKVPMPQTWIIGVDRAPPADLEFPLFVRTPRSSWKRGGTQSKVNNLNQLNDEMELLRRALAGIRPS